MITIAYSTRAKDQTYLKHVKDSCGIKNSEILVYENNNEFSLPELYNKVIKEAKNDIIVFIHDDLIFNTKSWGFKILSNFRKTDYGIIGVAGTTDLVRNPANPNDTSWWVSSNKMVGRVSHQSEDKSWLSDYSNKFDNPIPVCLVDGLFIGIDRTKIKSEFDERFKGFHYYDIPFCISNFHNGVKIGVTFDVDLTHKSVGKPNETFYKNMSLFNGLYGRFIPTKVSCDKIDYISKPVKPFKSSGYEISIIIPTKDKINLVIDCVNSIIETTKQAKYNIIIADTGSSMESKRELVNYRNAVFSNKNTNLNKFEIIEYQYYNFAKINNDVVKNHISDTTNVLLFCNNDIKLLNDAVDRCLNALISKNNVGSVGARLHFADNSIQHNGILGLVKKKDNTLHLSHLNLGSYYKYNENTTEVIGNTGAFLMCKRDLFERFYFNETYTECFEDAELNFQFIIDGKLNYNVGNAVAYHYESQTRNEDNKKTFKSNEDYKNNLFIFVQRNFVKLKKYMKLF